MRRRVTHQQTQRPARQCVDGLALSSPIQVIDAVTLIVALQQSGIHKFRHSPAEIGFAGRTYTNTNFSIDHGCSLGRVDR